MSDELDTWTKAAMARYERPAETDDLEAVEEQDDEHAADGAEQADAEGLPAGWSEFVDSLTPDEITRAEADPLWADAAFDVWRARTAATSDQQTGAENGPDGPRPQTGNQVVAWVEQNAAAIRRDHGMTPDQYLAAIAGSSRAEWSAFAAEAGIPVGARPAYGQLTKQSQTELVRNDLAKLTPADWAKLGK